MLPGPRGWLFSLALVLFLAIRGQSAQARLTIESGVKYAVYLSPKMTLQPGSVSDRFYYDVDFPRGHVAIKSFHAELVDDDGNPVPLYETYMHHWNAARYYVRQGVEIPKYKANCAFDSSDFMMAGNSGVCKPAFPQFFGLGSETRKTVTYIPHPYGIEVGNPDEVPQGFEEKWQINVHAIDIRGTEDKLGCIECRRDLYNITFDVLCEPMSPNYKGGFMCCIDETKCRVKEGFQGVERNVYMRYTVEWVDWDDSSIVPVKVYIFDVTDTRKKTDHGSNGGGDCKIEYDVESCSGGIARDRCVDTKRAILSAPSSGHIIYGVGHLHTGGISSALYREDGRVLCSSLPQYGEGNEAGNEAGYIVGMSTCYPEPGTVKISKGETIVFESNYSSAESHIGVMGLFYILVAEPPASGLDSLSSSLTQNHNVSMVPNYIWIQIMFGLVIAAAVAVAAIVVFTYRGGISPKEDGYETIVM